MIKVQDEVECSGLSRRSVGQRATRRSGYVAMLAAGIGCLIDATSRRQGAPRPRNSASRIIPTFAGYFPTGLCGASPDILAPSHAACDSARQTNLASHRWPACQDCKCFFAPFGENPADGLAKRLRSIVRALNRAFAATMCRFGKKDNILDGEIWLLRLARRSRRRIYP